MTLKIYKILIWNCKQMKLLKKCQLQCFTLPIQDLNLYLFFTQESPLTFVDKNVVKSWFTIPDVLDQGVHTSKQTDDNIRHKQILAGKWRVKSQI